MRVTGGEWRSRRLRGPSRTQRLRPTPDAMRERVFAVLAASTRDAAVLDLFAGTGAVGIEALSRGASRAVFVDAHPAATRLVRSNLESLDLTAERVRVLRRPAIDAVRVLARSEQRFDLVWADPPFDTWQQGVAALVAAVEAGIVNREATLCLECPARAAVEAELPPCLSVERDLQGGASRVVLLRQC